MGITAELVRNVLAKSRSIATHESNVRCNLERRKWKTSVRSCLCGDEINSVLAEEDSASVRSSKAAVSTQPEYSLEQEGNEVTLLEHPFKFKQEIPVLERQNAAEYALTT
ncbi:hypothetical protein DCAR_0625207 [Daucus carota subsp. sativus]|uniref:Uncharacterized protein n=1 Tax=Daucus carota subsp. sativus TaxID=79200 RepID=A0A161YF27_DAUCS|nr:hypothetical protein DCAR_0625207 [Daucus carota subsp. sativus]